jgi:hypothetical protein
MTDLIERISVLRLRPGDILVIESPRMADLPNEKREALMAEFQKRDIGVIITNDRTKLSIIRSCPKSPSLARAITQKSLTAKRSSKG